MSAPCFESICPLQGLIIAQAGLLRDRAQNGKPRGFRDGVAESSAAQTKRKTAGKDALAFFNHRAVHPEPGYSHTVVAWNVLVRRRDITFYNPVS